jgi:hypothetical protein
MSEIYFKKKYKQFVLWDNKAISYEDYYRIIDLIHNDIGKPYVLPIVLHKLFLFATNSKKYISDVMPVNIIKLNSEFILSAENNKKQLVKIVLPKDIKDKHDVSVYSPVGVACLGAKEKSQISLKYKDFNQKLQIEKIVSQP